jgi:hypothetical protein
MLFKIGDIVTIRKDLIPNEHIYYYNRDLAGNRVSGKDIFTHFMIEYKGEKVIIAKYTSNQKYKIRLIDKTYQNNEYEPFVWVDEMFEETGDILLPKETLLKDIIEKRLSI